MHAIRGPVTTHPGLIHNPQLFSENFQPVLGFKVERHGEGVSFSWDIRGQDNIDRFLATAGLTPNTIDQLDGRRCTYRRRADSRAPTGYVNFFAALA